MTFSLLHFAQQTPGHRHQVSNSGGRTKEAENPIIFHQSGKKTLPVKKVQARQGGRSGGEELIAPPLLSRCPPYASLPSTTVPGGREPRSVPGPKELPSSSTTLAALKSDPKEFRIRFQNTAEPSRTNTPRCRGREGNQGGR